MIQLTGEANKITPRVLLDGGGKKALGSLDIDPIKQGLTNKAFVDLLLFHCIPNPLANLCP